MTTPRAPFPSGGQAVLLVLALVLAELAAYAVLHAVQGRLGLSDDALDALAMLLGNAAVLTLAMQVNGLGFRALLHPSPASVGAVVGLLLLPVAALVPALVLVVTVVAQIVVWLWPMSAWEQALFERLLSDDPVSLLMVCLLAPVLEEMLFRGVLLRSFLARYPRGQAIAGSAILFGVAHLNIYQFFSALILGLVLAWLYERSRSLLPCIALHGLYNSALVLIEPAAGAREMPAWADSTAAIVAALGAGAAAACMLWWLLGRRRAGAALEESP